jgi:hypothetical protein
MTEQPEEVRPALSNAETYTEQCEIALGIVLGGEKVWATIPLQYIKAENIGGVIEAGLKNSAYLEQSTIENGAALIHGFIEHRAKEMTEWARRNGREDLLISMRSKLTRAMEASQDD